MTRRGPAPARPRRLELPPVGVSVQAARLATDPDHIMERVEEKVLDRAALGLDRLVLARTHAARYQLVEA